MKAKRSAIFFLLLWAFVHPFAGRGQSASSLSVTRIVAGLSRPTCVTAAPDDSNRLFVLEQYTGRIRIVDLDSRTVMPTPFLTVTNLTKGSEQGLLGLAFHPGFATNGYFFVNYTAPGGGAAGHTEIVRFQAQGDPALPPTPTRQANPSC